MTSKARTWALVAAVGGSWLLSAACGFLFMPVTDSLVVAL